MRPQPTASLSRRQLLAGATGGALLGSAWGLALRETSGRDHTPGLTFVWSRSGLAALVEYRNRRILLLDAPEAGDQQHLSELVTGFMRQRIDVLLAPDPTLNTMSTTMRDRWRIDTVLAVDPDTTYPGIAFAGRRLSIDQLEVTCPSIVTGGWSRDSPKRSSWYFDTRLGVARIAIVRNAEDLPTVLPANHDPLLVIVVDEAVEAIPAAINTTAVAAPTGAPIFTSEIGQLPETAIRVYPDAPMTFGLADDGIALLASS